MFLIAQVDAIYRFNPLNIKLQFFPFIPLQTAEKQHKFALDQLSAYGYIAQS